MEAVEVVAVVVVHMTIVGGWIQVGVGALMVVEAVLVEVMMGEVDLVEVTRIEGGLVEVTTIEGSREEVLTVEEGLEEVTVVEKDIVVEVMTVEEDLEEVMMVKGDIVVEVTTVEGGDLVMLIEVEAVAEATIFTVEIPAAVPVVGTGVMVA